MSAADDVARMLTLIPWLLERPGASIGEIAAAFGTTERRIREDLRHLDFCGLPGRGGGDLFEVTVVGDRVLVRMADELRRPLRLTPREAVRLVVTLSAVEQALGPELPALRSAVRKVREAANLPADAAVTVEAGADGWLGTVRDALHRRRRIRLTYQGRADERPRTRLVDPWQIDVTPDGWYLHGHDVEIGEHRVFRLDRMAEVEILDTPLVTDRPPTPLRTPTFQPGPDSMEVELLLAPSARWLAETLRCDVDEETADGRRVVFTTDAPGWVARRVLMAAPGVTIVRPDGLRDLLGDLVDAALARYGPSGSRGD